MNQELSIKLIREAEKTPKQTQRSLSQSCGVSLGSIHYCLNALVKKGYVRSKNFENAQNKMAYAYILTPAGINLKKELILKAPVQAGRICRAAGRNCRTGKDLGR